MIELQIVSLIVGVLVGAGAATLYHRLPKKRQRKKATRIRPKRNDHRNHPQGVPKTRLPVQT